MVDEYREDDGQARRRRRRISLKVAIAALVVAVAGAAYSYRVGNEVDQLREQVVAQSQMIQQTALDVAVLKAAAGQDSVDDQDLPAFCSCVTQESGKNPLQVCAAKNSTCDEESSRICESQFPGYSC